MALLWDFSSLVRLMLGFGQAKPSGYTIVGCGFVNRFFGPAIGLGIALAVARKQLCSRTADPFRFGGRTPQ